MKVVILRGLPGSGKTSYALRLAGGSGATPKNRVVVCSADHFFVRDGAYRFDPRLLPQAHAECLRRYLAYVQHPGNQTDVDLLVVDNTNLSAWEISQYYQTALAYNLEVCVVRVECDPAVAFRRQTHGVPWQVFSRMAQTMRNEFLPSHWTEKVVFDYLEDPV